MSNFLLQASSRLCIAHQFGLQNVHCCCSNLAACYHQVLHGMTPKAMDHYQLQVGCRSTALNEAYCSSVNPFFSTAVHIDSSLPASYSPIDTASFDLQHLFYSVTSVSIDMIPGTYCAANGVAQLFQRVQLDLDALAGT